MARGHTDEAACQLHAAQAANGCDQGINLSRSYIPTARDSKKYWKQGTDRLSLYQVRISM